jgi:7-cyano-7-deazaguanine synthase
MCALLVKQGWQVAPLFIDYQQRARAAERRAAHRIAMRLELPPPIVIAVTGLGGKRLTLIGGHDGARGRIEAPDLATAARREFVPQRNLFLLTLACIVAYQHGSQAAAIGVIGNDGTRQHRYPDIVPSYLAAAGRLFGRSQDIRILAPLLRYAKSAVVQLGERLHLDVELTYSCNTGPRPCLTCASCVERILGLAKFYTRDIRST